MDSVRKTAKLIIALYAHDHICRAQTCWRGKKAVRSVVFFQSSAMLATHLSLLNPGLCSQVFGTRPHPSTFCRNEPKCSLVNCWLLRQKAVASSLPPSTSRFVSGRVCISFQCHCLKLYSTIDCTCKNAREGEEQKHSLQLHAKLSPVEQTVIGCSPSLITFHNTLCIQPEG